MAKVSDSLLKSQNNRKVSSMVQAMRGWETSLATPSAKPSGQFGRVVKIKTGGLTIDNSLDVEFEIPFDDDTEANEATIVVYNLTESTIKKLKPNAEISVTAGYGEDTGVIFVGVISTVKTKWVNQDRVTTIKALDSDDLKERDVVSISFAPNYQASEVLRTLVDKLGLPIAVFKTRKDHTYTEAVTVSGELMSNIRQYAEVCGVSAYINKRKVYVQYLGEGENLGFTVDANSGLIESPEEFTEEVKNEDYTETINGVTFKMLLEHRVTTASIFNLKSRDYSGQYRVRSGKHICNEADFVTEITAIVGSLATTAPATQTAAERMNAMYGATQEGNQSGK